MSETTVKIFDTTLRDGEQSPGYSMDTGEKIRMAQQLARLGVDIIEAGFPIASPGDFAAVQKIAREVVGPSIAGLCRANAGDIDTCWQAIKEARKRRIHTFIATSDIHLKYKLRKSREEVLQDAVAAVKRAKGYTDDVEFSAEDATRSDRDYLAQVVQAVIEAGATTVNIPDTVGYTIPSEYASLIRHLMEKVPDIRKATVSVHCHNDLGLAVANSLAAVENGARQVECTINGIGERAGNASMEEIVMALKVRENRLGLQTNINTEQIYPTSKLLTHITGISVQPNKAIVGANAFAHESGIHQDGLLKNELTYSIMTPAQIGLTEHKYILGKHSGRHAFKARLKGMGFELSETELEEAFKRFKDLADRKKAIFEEDLEAIVTGLVRTVPETYVVKSVEVSCGTKRKPKASVEITRIGKKLKATETGAGPVDAVFKALKKLSKFKGNLEKFVVTAVTGGTDAQGEVMVELQQNGHTVRGVGSHTDIIVASAKAYVAALNRLEHIEKKVSAQL
ncbi:MAG TPA: 2-isopropylmalate synthase [bacterium]|nr:2-isopropylmalate synthase [bacterium]